MFNIVASDMDGTLLNEEHLLTEHTMQTLKKLVTEKGVTLVLATGRNYYDVRIVFNKLRDYFLGSEHDDINNENIISCAKDNSTHCVNIQNDNSNDLHKEEHEEKKTRKVDKETLLKDCVYLITSNGAVIHDALTQQVVYTKYINPTIAERLYRLYEDTDKNEKCESCECKDNKKDNKIIVNTHCYQNDEWYCTID